MERQKLTRQDRVTNTAESSNHRLAPAQHARALPSPPPSLLSSAYPWRLLSEDPEISQPRWTPLASWTASILRTLLRISEPTCRLPYLLGICLVAFSASPPSASTPTDMHLFRSTCVAKRQAQPTNVASSARAAAILDIPMASWSRQPQYEPRSTSPCRPSTSNSDRHFRDAVAEYDEAGDTDPSGPV